MEKMRRYRRNLVWVLVLAMTLGMVQYPVHNTPVSVKAADSQTEKKVTLSEDGVLKVEGVYSVSAEMLDGIEKQEILKIEFDENVYFIKDHTFEGCHNLTEITWGGVTKIGSYAFADCENLDMMSLTQKVDTIQEGAFWGCSNIKLVIMPNDLKKLEKDAFPLATSFVWRYSKNEDEVEDEAIDDAFWTGRTGTMYVPDTDKWNRIIQQLDEKKITWTKRIAVSVGPAAFVTKIRAILLRDTGATISPFHAFIFLQGLETLSLRVERHVENALKVVNYLENHPLVEKVNHPSVSNDPKQQELYKKYFPNGGGSIFTFEIKGSDEEAKKFIDHLQLFSLLANVADVKSLVIHPASTTHSQLNEEELADQGIKPNTIRLSIGTENVEDIIYDLEEAFKALA